MKSDQFEDIETRYLELRRRLETGELTQTRFRNALAEFAVQDTRGRTWRLGENGKWFLHEPDTRTRVTTRYAPDDKMSPVDLELPHKPHWSHVAFIILVIVFLLCDAALLIYVAGGNALSLESVARMLPTLRAASWQLDSSAYTTETTPDRLTPEAVQAAAPTAIPAPMTAPTLTPVPAAPTAQPTTGSLDPSAQTPQGLYVTGIRLSPDPPKRNQEISFFVTFLNVVGKPQNNHWTVLVFRPDNLKHAFGQTSISPLPNLDSGSTELQVAGSWKLTGKGPCENMIALVASVGPDHALTFFTRPDGQVLDRPFSVCP